MARPSVENYYSWFMYQLCPSEKRNETYRQIFIVLLVLTWVF